MDDTSQMQVDEAETLTEDTEQSGTTKWSAANEDPLIGCVQHILKLNGDTYSAGAIRDLPTSRRQYFDPISAQGALQSCGYKSSFGALELKDLSNDLCPIIGFDANLNAVVVTHIDDNKQYHVKRYDRDTDTLLENTETEEVIEADWSGYVILAKPEANRTTQASVKKNDWFWSAFRQPTSTYVQIILAAALSNLLGLSTALFMMTVYDRVVPNQAVESLIALTIGILVALGFDFVIKSLRAQFIDLAGRKADLRMARRIFNQILNLPLDNRRQNAGAMANIVKEFDTLREFFASATLVAIVDLPFVLFFVWVISLISGPLALIPLICIPLVIIIGVIIQPLLARVTADATQNVMSKQSVLVETLSGLETVQATGSGDLMRKRFEDASEGQSQLSLKSRAITQFAVNSSASIQQLAQVATIFWGVFLIQEGTITMGALIAAVILGGRAITPLSMLASAMSRISSAKDAFRRLSAIMEHTEATAAADATRLSRPKLRGDIEFKNVSYQHPGAKSATVSNLSFKIPAGQKVALIGRMGSGKSTVIRLMAGLIEPTFGSILIDGVDLRQIDKSDFRRNVGVMLQESWLFSGSVKDNLQMGFYEYSDEHILKLAKLCGVDEFVSKHPQGYDMQLREKGEGLSGGQRQSITLARALLHDPQILICDEPTSAMDTGSEKNVLNGLKHWLENKTLVAVTHRNTLLDLVDRVLVVDNGIILHDTTPAELRKQ